MKYITLLRGINVGGRHKVDMDDLKVLLLSRGFREVATYINSGNICFESESIKPEIDKELGIILEESFDFPIPFIVKTKKEILQIADIIPHFWHNDKEQKTDVAFLFDEVDSEEIIEKLPVKKEFINWVYTKGALIWNVKRSMQNKSQLSKLAGHKFYSFMTVRNVNTVRKLVSEFLI